MTERISLNNNQLKLIAMFSMLFDHIGFELLPEYNFLRIIGRLAFPIFAYMISEGCLYTHNKARYLASISLLAFVCQLVFFVTTGSLYQNVLVTFTLSIVIIFTIDNFINRKTFFSGFIMSLTLLGTLFICIGLPYILKSDFDIDYGIIGVLLPVVIYYAPKKSYKITGCLLMLGLMSYISGGIQWYSLFTILLLMLYNGERGKLNLKYLFYIFYPIHLAAIYLIQQVFFLTFPN